jgi:hypothetical protein
MRDEPLLRPQVPKRSLRRAPTQTLRILFDLRAVGLSNGHFNGQRIVVASMASAYAQTYTLRYRLAELHLINIRQDHTE